MPSFVTRPFIRTGTIEERPFQLRLAQAAADHARTLIVAPTALGKTVIAALVIAHEFEKNPSARILFLSPTRPLTEQHTRSLQKFLDLPESSFSLLTGSTPDKKRREMAANARIICATPQTVQSEILIQKNWSAAFDLVVFDEAHRAVGDYAYVDLANHFREKSNARFLALTASPGGTEEKIERVCANLQIDHVEIRRFEDEEVRVFANDIESTYRMVELPAEIKPALRQFELFMTEQLDTLKKMGLVPTNNLRYFNRKRQLELQSVIRRRITTHGKTQPSLFAAASKTAALLKIAHAHTLLETQGVLSTKRFLEKLQAEAASPGSTKAAKQILASEFIQKSMDILEKTAATGLDHPKKIELAHILADQFRNQPEHRAIVFSQYRDQIHTLVDFLSRIEGVKPCKFIGQADKENDEGMNQSEQANALEELKKGTYNTLVASSVGEEGLDIPNVDLVVFFDPVPSEIRTIQRRGRTGRFGKGKLVTLITKGTRDEAFYYVAKSKEKLMHATLSSMARHPPALAENQTPSPKQAHAPAPGFAPSEGKKTLEAGQSTLQTFSHFPDEKEPLILIDWREQSNKVTRALAKSACRIEFKQLDVADFVISDRIGIERKTVEDFLQSLIDGRLFEQIQRLVQTYPAPFLILEGNPAELFSTRNIHPHALVGCLTTIATRYRLPILYAESAEQTADFIYVTAKREQTGKKKEFSIRPGKKGHSLAERQRFVIESLPHTGPRLARTLLTHFGSIRNIVNARYEELQLVENLGEKKAKRILRVLRAHYSEDTPSKEKEKNKAD